MANRRVKMSIEDRAKQFAPFSALRGLNYALAEKEKIVVEKADISEDKADEIDRKLRLVKSGMIITLTFFLKGEYIELTGMVAEISFSKRKIRIVNTLVDFCDIVNIRE